MGGRRENFADRFWRINTGPAWRSGFFLFSSGLLRHTRRKSLQCNIPPRTQGVKTSSCSSGSLCLKNEFVRNAGKLSPFCGCRHCAQQVAELTASNQLLIRPSELNRRCWSPTERKLTGRQLLILIEALAAVLRVAPVLRVVLLRFAAWNR